MFLLRIENFILDCIIWISKKLFGPPSNEIKQELYLYAWRKFGKEISWEELKRECDTIL